MSSSRTPPVTDAGLLLWASDFSSYVAAHFAALGISSDTSADLTAKFNAYQVALENSTNPETRGPAKILQKKLRKNELLELCRPLAVQINANPNVTDEQRQALGLKIRDRHPTPVPVPSTTPKIDIVKVAGNVVQLRIYDSSTPKKTRPADTRGANVWSYVGATPPNDIEQWTFKGQPTRTNFEVEFSNDVEPGSKVWFTAAWYNPRGELGMLVAPVSTFTQFGGLNAAAAGEEGENVKLAA